MATANPNHYVSRVAQDAAKLYDRSYCDYLETEAIADSLKGYPDALTRTLSEALMGNEGI